MKGLSQELEGEVHEEGVQAVWKASNGCRSRVSTFLPSILLGEVIRAAETASLSEHPGASWRNWFSNSPQFRRVYEFFLQ